jgi:glycosyltransferase involved in cell wall biosynthesis
MTAARPRLLLVKPVVPYPPDQGTKVVSFALIEALRPAFDVTVLAKAADARERRAARELEASCDRVVSVFPSNKRSLAHRAAYKLWYSIVSALTRRSTKSLYDCPGALQREARRLAREHFDLVVIEYWQLYPLLEVFDPERTVLFTHDIDMLVNRQSALIERRLLHKIAAVRRWLVEQREEVGAYRRARRVLALTERDADAVRKLSRGRAEVDVLPFGLDPERFAGGEERRREVLFMGALQAPFNRDALEYLAREIYPLMDDVDDFQLTIVGGALPPALSYLERDRRVTVVGRVVDVRPYLHRAACIVIPLRFGGGLRIRTLEAMMSGLPVVCSTVAVAGMDFEPDRDYLLADSPADTAAAIRRLLEDPVLAERIAESARERASRMYGAVAQTRALRELFQSFITQ